MSWYQDIMLARMIAEERIRIPRHRWEHMRARRIRSGALRSLLTALLNWLF